MAEFFYLAYHLFLCFISDGRSLALAVVEKNSRKMEGALAGCQPLAGRQHQQCVEEEIGKHVIECSPMRQLAATAAQLQQCIHGAINFSSTTLWSETFGLVIADKFWDIRFWEGFAYPVMTAYCQKWHLDIADFRRGMFTAPVLFASDIWLQTCDGSFRTPWIVQQLPSNCRDDQKKEALEELAALMASQRRTDFSRPLLPEWHCRSFQQSSTAKAGVSHLDSSVEKETG